MDKKMDPGWNDPPMLNYTATNPPPKSRITNKRVAFPLFGNNANASNVPSLPAGSLPPICGLPPPLNPPPMASDTILSSEDLCKKVKDNLDKYLLHGDSQVNKENIELLIKTWEEQKFDVNCQNQIYLFTTYLVENNKADIQRIKEKLLSEFQTTCKAWLDNFKV